MSGIAGVFHRDGRPVAPALLERLIEAAPHRGPDGNAWRADGPIGVVHQRLVTTVEAAVERQPLVDPSDGCLLVFDGRIDNRRELRAGVEARGHAPIDDSDAALVLAAWRTWKETCAAEILGDFAFALWDAERRSLFCARDPMGVRPFYYSDTGRAFVWASELRQVLAHEAIQAEPDEGFVAELLAGDVRSTDATLYRSVQRLPPGHALLVDRKGGRRFRYWDFDLGRELRYRTDADYAGHFRELFERAVACRLRADREVAADLSGGLDSSSVVVVAAELARRAELPGIVACSMVYPGRPAADESTYIEDVVQAARVRSIRCPSAAPIAASWRARARARRDMPDFPNDALDAFRQAKRTEGVRVAVTGMGGDLGLTGSDFHHADLLRRGCLAAIARRSAQAARLHGLVWTSRTLWRTGVWPALPGWVKRALRPVARRWHSAAARPWIAAPFARRVALADRLQRDPVPHGLASVARYDVANAFRDGWQILTHEMCERGSAEYEIEERHPFYDRRLMEFMVALPDEQRWRDGLTKHVLREAMRGLLPESVRLRRDKADFSHLFVEALEGLGGERCFGDLTVARLGWVDPAAARALYQRMRARLQAGDGDYGTDAWTLWTIAGLEIWLRSIQEGTNDDASGQAA